jgi:ABC-type bacteriocin/lantibiotic exporter with double-glycine peptidase domain
MLFFIIIFATALAFFLIGFVVGSSIKRKDNERIKKEELRQRKYFERMEARR